MNGSEFGSAIFFSKLCFGVLLRQTRGFVKIGKNGGAVFPAFAQAAPPPNDDFESADDLGSAPSVSATESNLEATTRQAGSGAYILPRPRPHWPGRTGVHPSWVNLGDKPNAFSARSALECAAAPRFSSLAHAPFNLTSAPVPAQNLPGSMGESQARGQAAA